MEIIMDNLQKINKNILATCTKIGKKPENITLVAVTKTVSVSEMDKARKLGISTFGENKVQELLSKYDFFDKNVNWHLIGHLQTNKVKYIIDKVAMIHSVESKKLALEINNRALLKNLVMNILIEVNIGNEETKFGVSYEDVAPLIDSIKDLRGLRIKGLMTVAPNVLEQEENRILFKKMKTLFDTLKDKEDNFNNLSFEYLSMGMTSDYVVAIEEGSNMIRIGSGLFGERNYDLKEDK